MPAPNRRQQPMPPISTTAALTRMRHAARGAPGTFILKVGATGIAFLVNLLLARMLGLSGFGAYAYATTWASLLVVPAVLGLDLLLLREVAAKVTQARWDTLRGLLRFAYLAVAVASVGIAVVAGVLGSIVAGDPAASLVFWVAMAGVPLLALIRISQATMRGLHRVVAGQIPELAIKPGLDVVLIVAAFGVLGGGFDAAWAVGALVAASLVALAVGLVQVRRSLPPEIDVVPARSEARAWIGSAGPLLLIGGIQIVNRQIDIILVGALIGLEAAGVYTIASRGAELISFVLFAVNANLAPRIASLHAAGAREELERAVVSGARSATVFSVPLALGFVLFGGWFLSLFGPGFSEGAVALAILAVARVVAAFLGSVSITLTMTGNERVTATGMGLAAVVNVALNLALIPLWGLAGAAVASSAGLVLWNVILAAMVQRRLGIASTAWGTAGLRART
jgi:O-antigen/teichoic acid export membrane protein